MSYRINKSKCTSCQICIVNCPGATKIGADGKAEIVNQEKLEQCGGKGVCPIGAIEKIDKEGKTETETPSPYRSSRFEGRGMGAGRGRGRGRGGRN